MRQFLEITIITRITQFTSANISLQHIQRICCFEQRLAYLDMLNMNEEGKLWRN